MDKDVVERKLKAELDFFKVYAVFIIGLVTGNVNLLLREDVNTALLVKVLVGLSSFAIVIAFSYFIRSYFTIRKLTKQ